MKKIVLTTAIFCYAFSLVRAQDDMYFIPKKSDKEEVRQEQQSLNYRSTRDVDEYNRRGQFASSYFDLSSDTLYSDVLYLDYDTIASDTIDVDDGYDYSYNPEEDYVYTREMCRYDDFYWYDPWWYGRYRPYWYGGPYWYAGWWYGWYDPWYDPWYYGWYSPWWHYPAYWHVSYYRPYRGGITGTMNHGRLYGHNTGIRNNFNGYRGTNGNESDNRGLSNSSNRYNNSSYSNRFRGNRQNNSRQNIQSRPSYNNSFGSSSSFRGGGSFGGSRGGSGGGGFRGRR